MHVPQPELATALSTRITAAEDYAQWEEYAINHPLGTPFHLIRWKKTIEEVFDYRPYYLLAHDSKIRGILPLFFVRNPIIGRALISSPFAVYGGILSDTAEVREALYKHACELGRELNVDYIEFRNQSPEQCSRTPNVSRYVAFQQALEQTDGDLLATLPKKTRNVVRKALKERFHVRYGVTDTQVLDRVHARNMHRLGTPNFPRRYFDRLLANFREMADIREVWLENTPVAVSLNIFFRGSMHTYHAAADTRYNSHNPNTFMYYDHLLWAAANGYTIFDFGRCKRNTGVFQFKSHWNTTMRELPYEIVLINRKELPNFSPANEKLTGAIRLWKMLPPSVARLLSAKVLPLFP